jgi:hypothetical protein
MHRVIVAAMMALGAVGCYVAHVEQTLVEVTAPGSTAGKVEVARVVVEKLGKSQLKARLRGRLRNVSGEQLEALSLATGVVTDNVGQTRVYVKCALAYQGDSAQPAIIVTACGNEVAATIDMVLGR